MFQFDTKYVIHFSYGCDQLVPYAASELSDSGVSRWLHVLHSPYNCQCNRHLNNDAASKHYTLLGRSSLLSQ